MLVPMAEILTDLSEASLGRAVRSNLHEHFLALGRSPEAVVDEDEFGFRWHTEVPHPWFRGVFSERLPTADARRYIDDAVAFFRARGVDDFTWWLDPALDPAAWAPHLGPHGFHYHARTPGMAVELAALPHPAAPSPTVRRVEDAGTLAVWTRIFVRGYGLPPDMIPALSALMTGLGPEPPFRHYLGYLGDEPVAASTLFLGAGVAGLYNVATLTRARRQGFGRALTLIPLREAHEAGYRAAVLQSSEMALTLYRRLGFRHVGQIDHFLRHPPFARAGRGRPAGG